MDGRQRGLQDQEDDAVHTFFRLFGEGAPADTRDNLGRDDGRPLLLPASQTLCDLGEDEQSSDDCSSSDVSSQPSTTSSHPSTQASSQSCMLDPHGKNVSHLAGVQEEEGRRGRSQSYHENPDPDPLPISSVLPAAGVGCGTLQWASLPVPKRVDRLEQRAMLNTSLYMEDGKTLNPLLAPFVPTARKPEPDRLFWTWSVRMQRWYHRDKENDSILLYPRNNPSGR